MSEKKGNPGLGNRVLGLDFGKYLLSSHNRRSTDSMESDNATGTESDLSDWEYGNQYYAQNSEESDDFGMYSSDGQMFDTAVDTGDRLRLDSRRYPEPMDRQSNQQIRGVVTQLNSSNHDSAYGSTGYLYPIRESGSQMSDSSGENNSDGTLSDSGSPVHNPVYGRYQKFQNQTGNVNNNDQISDDELESLMLHRLPGENLGMILGIEGGKDGTGKVSSVTVKSVTLGGAAYRATGGSKGLCVGDEIIQVNNTNLHTLHHDECISVFKDMPLRVLLGVKRGQKDLPPVSISPLPPLRPNPPTRLNTTSPHPVQITRRRDMSDSEEEGSGSGFAVYSVTVVKEPDENLGLSIVPSYGSTKEYYQIKRILPSGAAAQSGVLQVGDRLVSCNGTNLRALTQAHCLNIIKSASSLGDVTFEVIRPVYDGSPMEISVTLNNNSTKLPTPFDPQQFSLKSQSYDRHVDVIVTSESDDYLTVSEDEFSRKRLADIPEVEANEVFATNSVKLAFQKPFNTIEEEITETEEENIPVTNVSEVEDTDIVDLNRIDTSPYHIPKKTQNQNSISLTSLPKTDIDSISTSSKLEYSNQVRTDIDSTSVTSVSSLSPRLPVPRSDLDSVNTNFNYSKRQQVPKESDEETISPPYNYPSQNDDKNSPVSEIDSVKYNPLYEDSNISDFTDSEQGPSVYTTSYNKQGKSIPYSDLDKISVSSNRSVPHTEIDKVSVDNTRVIGESQDQSISNSDSDSDTQEPLPPPVEFSDKTEENSSLAITEDREIYLPYTNIDDIVQDSESTVEISPTHHEIEIVGTQRKPHHTFDLESSFRELERASDDNSYNVPDLDDPELAFNSELTAPFDSVLQDPSLCVQSSHVSLEYSDTVDNEILQVVQSYEDGTVVISQFDPQDRREITDSPAYIYQEEQSSDSTMDNNSEAMLKNALDMEYEKLPESSKLETRVQLGINHVSEEHDFEDPAYRNNNVVAENIAEDIIKQENGGIGHYIESDDEPDTYPDQDNPGDAPDLPDQPPPMLNMMPGTNQFLDMYSAAESVNVEFSTPQQLEPTSDLGDTSQATNSDKVVVDSNWSFKSKVYVDGNTNNNEESQENDEMEIVPVQIERKAEIPKQLQEIKQDVEDDIIVPVKTERQHSIPSHFTKNEKHELNTVVDDDEEDDGFVMVKKAAPPAAPKPAPRKNISVISVAQPSEPQDPVEEEIIKPTDRMKDVNKNLVNVISVVNALKAASKDQDPDVVDKIVKEDVKDRLKNRVSTVIGVTRPVEISPPKHEQIVTQKEEINVSVKRKLEPVSPKEKTEASHTEDIPVSVELSPPKQSVIEETKDAITKPMSRTVLNISGNQSDKQGDRIKDPSTSKVEESTGIVTSISVENSKVAKETVKPDPVLEIKQAETKPKVPPPTLPKPTREKKDTVMPSGDNSNQTNVPTPAYRTTIGVTNKPGIGSTNKQEIGITNKTEIEVTSKPEKGITNKTEIGVTSKPEKGITNKTEIGVTSKPEKGITNKPENSEKRTLQPTPQIKPLSHIKPLSFNPKSLSQSRPVQYKTTISALGSKPSSGISTLGRSSLLNPQKAEHPIKRMETMPFEVSILKGILGIGIKTKMTPEGFVQVSEILPNGPVGREGNIKVGDYLLSINNTPLTGLPDSKVQQILRLLPRGLSKIVASAVPPDGSENQNVNENKAPASPRQTVTSHTKQPASISTVPKPSTLASLKSGKTDTSPQVSPRSPKSISPVASPRQTEARTLPLNLEPKTSPRSPKSISPVASPRIPQTTISTRPADIQISTRSPKSASASSPIASPRKQEAETISPRSPPPVAPKPRRSPKKENVPVKTQLISETVEIPHMEIKEPQVKDSSGPIETEIFVSISGTKNEHTPTAQSGPNILPGSTSYDSVQKVDKTGWTQGVVSSTDIKSRDLDIETTGKTDVVSVTNSQSNMDVKLTCTSQQPETNDVSETEIDTESLSKDTNTVVEEVKDEINETFEKLSQVETESPVNANVITNRPRTFSASSESSSYTEFTECNVEDELIPEQITEEEESENIADLLTSVPNTFQQVEELKNEEYEPDFNVDKAEASGVQTSVADTDNKALKVLAENIVSEVIESVKEMNLAEMIKQDNELKDQTIPPALPNQGPPDTEENSEDVSDEKLPPLPDEIIPSSSEETIRCDAVTLTEEAPPLPTEVPPLPSEAPPLLSEAPPLLDEPPPLPKDAPPAPEIALPSGVTAPVVDLTLYPDEIEPDVKEDKLESNTVDSSYTAQMHVSAPAVDVVNSQTDENMIIIDKNDFLSKQVTSDSKEVEEDIEGNVLSGTLTDDKSSDLPQGKEGDKNISDVISMYADIERKMDVEVVTDVNDVVNSETNIVKEKSNNNEEVKPEIHLEVKHDRNVPEEYESCDTKSLTSSEDFLSDTDAVGSSPGKSDEVSKLDIESVSQADDQTNGGTEDTISAKVNGHEKRPPTISIEDKTDEKTDSLSPRSESKFSPRSVDALLSELDSPREKYSPELDRMFRMFSTEEESKPKGEGEVIHLKLNRGVTGLGFVIQGGKGSPKGDLPISVKKIFKGGPAEGLLEMDDEIMEVDGEDMSGMRQLEARTHLKFLPTGDVNITVRRFRQN